MRALGIVRKMDELGRIVVPIEVRRVHGWKEGTSLEVFATDEGISLREYQGESKKDAAVEKLKTIESKTPDQETKMLIREVRSYLETKK